MPDYDPDNPLGRPLEDDPPEDRPVSKAAMRQKFLRELGNCISCAYPRGDSPSRHLCEVCLHQARLRSRKNTRIPENWPVNHWPPEWSAKGVPYYTFKKKCVIEGVDATPQKSLNWPPEWDLLTEKEAYRRVLGANNAELAKKQLLAGTSVPEFRHIKKNKWPSEWRRLPRAEYLRRVRAALKLRKSRLLHEFHPADASKGTTRLYGFVRYIKTGSSPGAAIPEDLIPAE